MESMDELWSDRDSIMEAVGIDVNLAHPGSGLDRWKQWMNR